jgi:hypothetical protein
MRSIYENNNQYLIIPSYLVDNIKNNQQFVLDRNISNTNFMRTEQDAFVILRIRKWIVSLNPEKSIIPVNPILLHVGKKKNIKVASWNIHNNSRNSIKFAQLILQYEIDVICLNECDHSIAKKILSILEKHGYSYGYASADYAGNAIFCRYSIRKKVQLTLSSNSGSENRSGIMILTDIADIFGVDNLPKNIELWFVGTHLSHTHENDRVLQCKGIIDEVTALIT